MVGMTLSSFSPIKAIIGILEGVSCQLSIGQNLQQKNGSVLSSVWLSLGGRKKGKYLISTTILRLLASMKWKVFPELTRWPDLLNHPRSWQLWENSQGKHFHPLSLSKVLTVTWALETHLFLTSVWSLFVEDMCLGFPGGLGEHLPFIYSSLFLNGKLVFGKTGGWWEGKSVCFMVRPMSSGHVLEKVLHGHPPLTQVATPKLSNSACEITHLPMN